jgi:hypothetical protein
MGHFKSSTISGHVMGVFNLVVLVISMEEMMQPFVDQIKLSYLCPSVGINYTNRWPGF